MTTPLADEFMHPRGLCGLCGNTGVVDTRSHVASMAGVACGVRAYCLCPNGRAWKEKGAALDALPTHNPTAFLERFPSTMAILFPILAKSLPRVANVLSRTRYAKETKIVSRGDTVTISVEFTDGNFVVDHYTRRGATLLAQKMIEAASGDLEIRIPHAHG